MVRKLAAELIGTFWLVFGGCGSAVIAATFPEVGIGLVGVSLAFGLQHWRFLLGAGRGRFGGNDLPLHQKALRQVVLVSSVGAREQSIERFELVQLTLAHMN